MTWRLSNSIVVLALIIFVVLTIVIIFAILSNQDKKPPVPFPPGPVTQPNPICNVPGFEPKVDSLPYVRQLPYSNGQPYSESNPDLVTIQHPVPKLKRLRSSKIVLSPNHWLGAAMYGTENIILCYPYLLTVEDDGLLWGWPNPGVVTELCNQTPCQIGQEQLIYSTGTTSLKLGCANQTISACDIVNVDALTATINWQYTNRNNSQTTAFQAIICQGCPYLTINNLSLPLTIDGIVSAVKQSFGYLINSNYALFLPNGINLTQQHQTLYQLPPFQGSFRLAYFHDATELQILSSGVSMAPTESQVNVNTNINSGSVNIQLDYLFNYQGTGTSVMCRLPHQKLTQYQVLATYSHPILGPYQLITTTDNNWHLQESIIDYPLTLPSISNSSLLATYQADVKNLTGLVYPNQPVQYLAWLGSIANLLLIGKALNQDISVLQAILAAELNKITVGNGIVTNNLAFTYDTEWGGTISNLGITDCQGTVDQGNAYYQNHIGHHGYLIYAYAVAAISGITIDDQMALNFVRSLMNSSTDDQYFPLWRHKHWYLGYSLNSGLVPGTFKNTENVGEIIAGYYGGYLLGKVLNNSQLMSWSAALLATEISSIQTNFQFASSNDIQVDPHFVQGTITSRGDNYYAYITDNQQLFPEKNAAMSISLLKPLVASSQQYVDLNWTQTFAPYVLSGLTNSVEPETLCYGSVVVANSNNYNSIINRLVANSNQPLPYGSIWSAAVWWILITYS